MKLHKEIIQTRSKVGWSAALLLLVALLATLTAGLDRNPAHAAPPPLGSTQATTVAVFLEPSSAEVFQGQTFAMDIMVDSGDQEVTGVQAFLDFDPALLEVVDADPVLDGVQVQAGPVLPTTLTNSADNNLGQIDYAAGKLEQPFPSGEFVLATITFRAKVQTPATDITFSTVPPRDTFADFLGTPQSTSVSGATVVVNGRSDLRVSKSVSNPTPNEGETITYTIIATNLGPSNATGVEVIDNLPAGVTYISDNSSGAYDPDTGVLSVGELAGGSPPPVVVALEIVAQVDRGTAGTTITNIASISGDQEDPDPTNNESGVSITVQGVDLALEKAANVVEAAPGEAIRYSITVSNNGLSGATGVQVTDILPAEVTHIANNGGGSFDPDTGVWLVGDLSAGSSATLNVMVRIRESAAGSTVTNTASVSGDQPDPVPGNNSASVAVLVSTADGPQLFIEPEASIVGVGQIFEVQIRVDPRGQPVAGVQAFVNFDPAKLRVQDVDESRPGVQIQNGDVLIDFQTLNNANNALGQIDYAAGNLSGGSPFPTQEFVLATIRFEALELTGDLPTLLTFSNSPETRRTKVSGPGGQNITGPTRGAIVDIIEAVSLRINFRLQGGDRPRPEGWEQAVTARLINRDTGQEMLVADTSQFDAVNLQAFIVVPIVPAGVYDIMLTGPSTLTNVKRGFTVDLGVSEVDLGVLLAGNAEVVDTPNIIDIQDFGLLAGAFGTMEGDPGFDPRADFDSNKLVNISDFGLLVRNFLRQGPVEVS